MPGRAAGPRGSSSRAGGASRACREGCKAAGSQQGYTGCGAYVTFSCTVRDADVLPLPERSSGARVIVELRWAACAAPRLRSSRVAGMCEKTSMLPLPDASLRELVDAAVDKLLSAVRMNMVRAVRAAPRCWDDEWLGSA